MVAIRGAGDRVAVDRRGGVLFAERASQHEGTQHEGTQHEQPEQACRTRREPRPTGRTASVHRRSRHATTINRTLEDEPGRALTRTSRTVEIAHAPAALRATS
jgi:hypothetical protein